MYLQHVLSRRRGLISGMAYKTPRSWFLLLLWNAPKKHIVTRENPIFISFYAKHLYFFIYSESEMLLFTSNLNLSNLKFVIKFYGL